MSSQVKSSHLYLYSAFNNKNCVKATAQYQNRNLFELKAFHSVMSLSSSFKILNAVLQMLETWLSKERLLSNSTPRFLTDDEELREQPSSVRQCTRLLCGF